MAYQYQSKTRRKRKPRKYNRAPKPITTADAAYKLAGDAVKATKYLKSLINVEFKYKNVDGLPVSSTTGSMTLLNGVGQGDSDQTRDGKSIRFTSINQHIQFAQHPSATHTIIRYMLVWYYENNASAKTISNILETSDPLSFYEMENTGKFKVLKDMDITMVNGGSSAHQSYRFSFPVSLHSVYTEGAAGSAATDINKGALYMLVLSNEATNTPTVDHHTRLRFVDN